MTACQHLSGGCDRVPKASVAIASLFLLVWLLFGCPADCAACRHPVGPRPGPPPPLPPVVLTPAPQPPVPPPAPIRPVAVPALAADPIPHPAIAVPASPAPAPAAVPVPAPAVVLPVPGIVKTAHIFTGAASVTGSRPAAEVAPERAFDRNSTTDVEDAPADAVGGRVVTVRFDARQGHELRIIAYAITSSEFGDPVRDPSAWRLIGVQLDGSEVVIDRRTGESFAHRTERRVFAVQDVPVCRAFRLEMNAGDGGSVRLAEIEFIAPR